MKEGTSQKISNVVLASAAGFASFVFSLGAFLYIREFDGQVLASIVAGTFCLLVSYVASERPNSQNSRALSALAARLLAVERGDLTSPAPPALKTSMPDLASAVENLFSEVRASIENAHALGMYDPVTSLPNRLHFRSEADKLLGESVDGQRSAILFVDLDRFKSVNDSLGHARGDRLLTMVANRLRVIVTTEVGEETSRRPLLARLAGDEFTLFFTAIESVEDIERIARRIALSISEPFEVHGHSINIGASVGIAICPDHGDSIETLMRAADIAMYRAKSLGGGQHCLFDEALAAEHQDKVRTEQALASAVQRDEFQLVLQPQVSLANGETIVAEALLRWNHPEEGVRMPSSFVSVAESTGLIADIGDWMIEELAVMLSSWQRQGIEQRVAFNVSPRQLERADFFSRLQTAFAAQSVPLSLIELEFTETAAMEAGDSIVAEIARLRLEGVRMTIDDFGTGYSNLARLRSMPLDRVKLDRSLIADIEHCEKARVVVQALIQLIGGIGCETVADSVETAPQAEILRTMGCHTVQGRLLAQPMSEKDFLEWMQGAATDSAVA